MSIHGIDVSEYQGRIDWDEVKRAGVQFVMLRAGYGAGNLDKEFRRNAKECNRIKMPFGVYWFSYAYTEKMAEKEADDCIRAIKDYEVQYPVCIDFEEASVQNAREHGKEVTRRLATSIVEAFLKRIEEAGYFAMYYSNLDYLKRIFDDSLRKKYALWFAQYASVPSVTRKAIWQYRDNGRVRGIQGDVDMDIAYHDYAKTISQKRLNKMKRNVSTPDSLSPEPPDIIEYTVRKGDTLSGIAERYRVDYRKLAVYNDIKNPDRIYPGQVIKIPLGTGQL